MILYVILKSAVLIEVILYKMYKNKNYIYPDAGKILKSGNKYGYKFRDTDSVSELDIFLNDMTLEDGYVCYSNNLIKELYYPNETYDHLKSRIIKKLFSNDDQIAIILNKDDSEEDLLIYNKMQEWRAWAGIVAKKIKNLE